MIVAGLTGGIASGKSLVADTFRELGAHVIDFDELSRDVVQPGTGTWKGVVDYFGSEILNEDQTIDRDKLGNIVFNDEVKRRKLEDILHPEIFREDRKRTEEIKREDPNAVLIKDIPLLIEVQLQDYVDKIIVVYVSEDMQIRRLMERDGFSWEEAEKRIALQMLIDEKLEYADFTVDNEGSVEDTQRQVKEIFEELSELSSAE